MSKTPEEMAEKWSVVVFDESELPEHERTKFSDWSIYKAMATMGFLAGYKAAQENILKQIQLVADNVSTTEYPYYELHINTLHMAIFGEENENT
jgi:hypothetical protein